MVIADIDYHEYFLPERLLELQQALARPGDADESSGRHKEPVVQVALKELGHHVPKKELRELLADLGQNREVDFEEFCVAYIKLTRARPRADLIESHEYLDEAAIRQLKQKFLQQDEAGKGFIGVADVDEIVAQLGGNAEPDDVDDVIAQVDKEKTGMITFDKLCVAFAVLKPSRRRINYREYLSGHLVDNYRSVFNSFDMDADGQITLSELNSAARHLGTSIQKRHIEVLLKEFEMIGKPTIDFPSFCTMMVRALSMKRIREINPGMVSCASLWNDERFTVQELRLSGFRLCDFKKIGIPVGKMYNEGRISALEFRHEGYTPVELRRGGVGCSELRSCGFSLADLRNAGFSDSALSQTNRMLRNSMSEGDFSMLPQRRPSLAAKGGASWDIGDLAARSSGMRQMTPMIREHIDGNPRRSRQSQLAAAGAMALTISVPESR